VIAIGFLVPIVTERRRRRRAAAAATVAPDTAAAREPRAMLLDGETVFSAVIVALFAWALWQSRTFGTRAGLFPWAVGVPGILLGLGQLARDLTGRRETRADGEPASPGPPRPLPPWRRATSRAAGARSASVPGLPRR